MLQFCQFVNSLHCHIFVLYYSCIWVRLYTYWRYDTLRNQQVSCTSNGSYFMEISYVMVHKMAATNNHWLSLILTCHKTSLYTWMHAYLWPWPFTTKPNVKFISHKQSMIKRTFLKTHTFHIKNVPKFTTFSCCKFTMYKFLKLNSTNVVLREIFTCKPMHTCLQNTDLRDQAGNIGLK